MTQTAKSILLLCIITGNMLYSFADRGVRSKSKNKVVLNINTQNSFKRSLLLNVSNGLRFNGAIYTGQTIENGITIANNLYTYQKGNTFYLSPSKQKVVFPEIKQGYTGMKLIIKSKN
jgi:hypothetical protein